MVHHPSPHPKSGISIGSAALIARGYDQQTNSTRILRYISSNRPHLCTVCMRCGLKNPPTDKLTNWQTEAGKSRSHLLQSQHRNCTSRAEVAIKGTRITANCYDRPVSIVAIACNANKPTDDRRTHIIFHNNPLIHRIITLLSSHLYGRTRQAPTASVVDKCLPWEDRRGSRN